MKMLKSLHKDESGQDMIEYALLAVLLSLAAVALLPSLGSDISSEYSKIAAQLT